METTTRKPWSELALLLTLGTALLIAAAATDAFDSPEARTLLAVLAAGATGTTTETAAEVVVSEEQL